MSGNWINIYKLSYNAAILKKIGRLSKIALLGPYLGKNRDSMGHIQNQVLKIIKGDYILSRTFCFIKTSFWLSYECFGLVLYFAAKIYHFGLKQQCYSIYTIFLVSFLFFFCLFSFVFITSLLPDFNLENEP